MAIVAADFYLGLMAQPKMRLSSLMLFLGLLLQACDRPDCINTTSSLEGLSPGTFEYQQILAHEISKHDDLRYWLKDYYSEGRKEYIVVYIQNTSLCAQGTIRVKNWNKIEGIRRTAGEGYFGAELRGLKINIKKEGPGLELVYAGLDKIID